MAPSLMAPSTMATHPVCEFNMSDAHTSTNPYRVEIGVHGLSRPHHSPAFGSFSLVSLYVVFFE